MSVIYVYSNPMGRKKKPPEEKREDLSSKVLPGVKQQVLTLAAVRDVRPSRMVEILVQRGLQGVEDDKDDQTQMMLSLWRQLIPELRDHVINVTRDALKLNTIASGHNV
jgi:hypothetical protein